ncbi:coproporphyrinogen III oxidase [Hathewaya histolytica]|uniref:coproporphyrinogen III oxidase n=1 Tax=Hathewaya histolytica TaxID=1498 RepID=UPI003B672AA0
MLRALENDVTSKVELRVKLNDFNYRYDVYQMINIFLPFKNIVFQDENPDFEVIIEENYVMVKSESMDRIFKFKDELKLKQEVKKSVFKYFEELTGKFMPWGTLIGIRPSKIAMSMLIEGVSEEDIIKYFKNVYISSKEKTELCIEVAKREMKYIKPNNEKVSIYIGMPFCPTRCLYCSFAANPIAGFKKEIIEDYLNTLKKEIEAISSYLKKRNLKLETLYFGGGTPTSINDDQFEDLMKYIHKFFIQDFNVKEVTVECGRPDSITYKKLETMRKYEVTRISINPQTMNDNTLKLIGRNHNSCDILKVFKLARELQFKDINMDIIVGLPGEKLSDVQKTCSHIKELKPDSFTVHGLSVKRASRLYENVINNIKYELATQNELNLMFKETELLAQDLQMKPYYMYRQKNMVGNMENIGYSKEGKESIYNIEMMEDKQTIVALGADAVTKVVYLESGKIERFGNVKDVKEYINRINEMIEKKIELLDNLYV